MKAGMKVSFFRLLVPSYSMVRIYRTFELVILPKMFKIDFVGYKGKTG